MTRNEELAAVIHLACQTEHRTDAEQRALLAVAWRCDREANHATDGRATLRADPDFRYQNLTLHAAETRVCSDDDRPIAMPKSYADVWQRWAANA